MRAARAPTSRRRLGVRFSRYTAGSLLSTVLSQATLTAVYGLGGTGATTAAVLAFVAGAVPNFALNWRWTWGRAGRPALVRELLPYLAIVVGGGLAATGLTALADHLLGPALAGRGLRTIALNLVYLGSYALFFVVKFALLDRVLGGRAAPSASAPNETRDSPRTPATTSGS